MFKIKLNTPLKNACRIPVLTGKPPSPNFQVEEVKEGNPDHRVPQEGVGKNLYLQNLVAKGQAGEREIKMAIEMLKKAAKEIELEKHKIIAEGEREMLKMIMAITRKVIKRETRVDPDIIVRVARDALKQAMDARRILIKVNPLDWKRIKEVKQELLSPGNNGNGIQIEQDKNIQQGGCIIKTEKETIDARIDQQIGEIERTLVEIEGE